jgi:hypothetical protein
VGAFIKSYNSFVPLHEIDSPKESLSQTPRGGALPRHPIPVLVFLDGLRGEIQDDQLALTVTGRGKAKLANTSGPMAFMSFDNGEGYHG